MAQFRTFIYNTFISTAWFSRYRGLSELWYALWNRSCVLFSAPVETRIHGRRITVNYGYPYPWIVRQFSSFNNPLIELVQQAFTARQRAISIIDAGASVGDTIIMLDANCPGMIGPVYCLEADGEYFSYLKKNLNYRADVECYNVLLSSDASGGPSLVRTHSGTASASGAGQQTSVRIDDLFHDEKRVDLMKIDVDGFDGRVLQGSSGMLKRDAPEVIFEWHPGHCKRTGNDWHTHFTVLKGSGYSQFIFFTKAGEFSHFMNGYDPGTLETLARFCLANGEESDWHYDVIALHTRSRLSAEKLAQCFFARQKPSPY